MDNETFLTGIPIGFFSKYGGKRFLEFSWNDLSKEWVGSYRPNKKDEPHQNFFGKTIEECSSHIPKMFEYKLMRIDELAHSPLIYATAS